MGSAGWSEWKPFPDPDKGDFLTAPFGAGCYELRNAGTGELILFGTGSHVAERVASLLPAPKGSGTRNNHGKRDYVDKNLKQIEYRTIASKSRQEAKDFERTLKADKDRYLFKT